MRIAAVDIGSNTLLLLIVERDGSGRLTPIRDECRFGRLGQGLDATGKLADEAIERSLAIAREYRAIMDEVGVDTIVIAGTEAMRVASNAALFVGPAETILGAPIEVVPGEREARLVHRAVVGTFDDLARASMVIADVGGASTEVIVAVDGEVQSVVSLPIGAVRLSERHLTSDPPTAEQARALVADVDATIATLSLPTGVPLIATAGTATTLASVEQKLRVYAAERVNGYRLTPGAVDRLFARFLELTVAEKRHLPGLEPERADVIAGGAAIYARLCARIAAPELIVSDRGMRWGLVFEAASAGA